MKKKILFATISSIVATLSIQTNADYSGSFQPPPNTWLNKFSKVSLVKTDNSIVLYELGNINSTANYQFKESPCNVNFFQEWYYNPALVKEIRLHN